jgi:hypothetical protein
MLIDENIKENHENDLAEFKLAAKRMKNKIISVTSGVSKGIQANLADFMGVQGRAAYFTDDPAVKIWPVIGIMVPPHSG